MLAGRTPALVLGTTDDSTGQEIATQLKGNLEQAGFTITVKNIPADSKLDETKKKDNPWDLYVDSWAADWPSGAAILPLLFDGRTIKAEGNSNTSTSTAMRSTPNSIECSLSTRRRRPPNGPSSMNGS